MAKSAKTKGEKAQPVDDAGSWVDFMKAYGPTISAIFTEPPKAGREGRMTMSIREDKGLPDVDVELRLISVTTKEGLRSRIVVTLTGPVAKVVKLKRKIKR